MAHRWIVALIPLLVATGFGAPSDSDPALLYPEAISYLGAFRLEERWAPNYSTWEYSNGPLAYYPGGDPNGPEDGYPGSLFMAGHVYASKVAELEIPAPIESRTVDGLPVARVLQRMTDITAGLPDKSGFIMGMTYVPSQGRIYFTYGQDYSDGDCDPSNSPPGLGSFKPALSNPDTTGLWFISAGGVMLHPFTSLRYIMEIPQDWADANLQGRALATGRHRGWCPEGTNLYASAPWAERRSLRPGTTVSAATLMEFGDFPDKARWSKEHSSANAYQGGAWLTSGDKAAVVISGIIDYDRARSYYGYENWKYANQCDPDPRRAGCSGQRGWRAANPKPAFLFYRPKDLADVANGLKRPWEVEWYAKLDLSRYMLRRYLPTMLTTGADAEDVLMTFDRRNGLIYVSESFADGPRPVVHVFKVTAPGNDWNGERRPAGRQR